MRDRDRPRRRIDWGMLLALAALGTGLLWIVADQRTRHQLSSCSGRWPSPVPARRWSGDRPTPRSRSAGGPRPAAGPGWRPFVARGGWPALVRVIVGLGLVGAAFGIVIAQQSQIDQLPEVMAMTTLALAGLAHRVGALAVPLPHRPQPGPGRQGPGRRPRRHGRAPARLRAADPGADPAAGRRPEGGAAARPPAGARAAHLARTARSRRRDPQGRADRGRGGGRGRAGVPGRGGDGRRLRAPPSPVQALVRAAREAMVNAAKHSGADKIDVYAEVDEERIEVFVRDRGSGFDVDPGRRRPAWASRGSIINRMARHGGTATVRSEPGDGTEVRLEIPR